MYQATFRNKHGAIRDTAFATTREEAARILFARHPTCQSVQVCNAYRDDNHRLRGNGMDISWISRRALDLRSAP